MCAAGPPGRWDGSGRHLREMWFRHVRANRPWTTVRLKPSAELGRSPHDEACTTTGLSRQTLKVSFAAKAVRHCLNFPRLNQISS
jgi:hypothetical protein